MVSKEEFCDILGKLEKYTRNEEEAINAFDNIYKHGYLGEFVFDLTGKYLELITRIIEKDMRDNNGWVFWWVYDDDFGKNKYTIDGKTIDSADELYDVIIGERQEAGDLIG